jgi:carboxyl-terminal processing protease
MVVRGANGTARAVALPLKQNAPEPDVSARMLEGGFGYIRIRSLANLDAVAAFDFALEPMRAARGLIIDVRDNGGGDTAVARPMMGRFITQPMPYAHMRRRAGRGLSAPWVESVDPRGPFTFTAPVVVLCNHWSGSMAEGFPMGMRDIGRARIVGTRMMGLGAAVFAINLDRTGISAHYSAEPVYDTHDAPRWELRPDVEVAPGDDILAAGVRELARLTQP